MKCSKTNRAIDVELFKVCAEGTVEEVRELLSRGANPSAPYWAPLWDDDLDPEDYYCVHEAARNPDMRVHDLLIEHGANPNVVDYWGRQPLAYAGRCISLEMARHLVELGNDPNGYDDDGGTVLSCSALNPDVRVLEFLIERGAEVGGACIGGSELDIALKRGTPERIRFFIEHGSELKYLSIYSFEEAPLENIRVLLEYGLDLDYKDPAGFGRLVDILDPARRALIEKYRRAET